MGIFQVPDDEIEPILKANIPSPEEIRPDFHTFRYTPRSIMERDTPMAIITIFKDLNMLQRWRIPSEVLARLDFLFGDFNSFLFCDFL